MAQYPSAVDNEVLLRSAAVNFTPSLDALASRLRDAPLVSSPSAPSE